MVLGKIYLTTNEAAELLGVTDGRVRQFVVEERLTPVDKVGPALVFLRKDVEEFAEKRRVGGRPKKS